MGTVFVIQEPKPGPKGFTYDISPAMGFGAIEFVFEAREQPGMTPGPAMFKALKKLRGFSDDDYLLWAGGDPAGLSIVTMAAAAENMGRIKFLRWERGRDVSGERTRGGFYIAVPISLHGVR